ncbi:hypothetical protein ACTXT7_010448 [Hymenolepis weldensis]
MNERKKCRKKTWEERGRHQYRAGTIRIVWNKRNELETMMSKVHCVAVDTSNRVHKIAGFRRAHSVKCYYIIAYSKAK